MPAPSRRLLPTAVRIGLIAALASALSAIAIAYRTRETERANPPRGKFIEVDGVCLHYRERGQGPALVLLHGNGTMLQDFEVSGVPALAEDRYRVVIFDRVGFGHSDRPRETDWTPERQAALLSKAFDRLGIARPIVLGHSWGTQVALALALDRPEQVRCLILLSGYYFPTLRLDALLLSTPALPVIGDFMRHTISPWLGRLMWPALVKKMFAPNPVTPRFAAFPVWMALRPSQLRAAAAESGLMVPDAETMAPRYGELSMPVFIMAGDKDEVVDTRHQSMHLHDAIPHSTLWIIRGAGHMVHHVAPQKVIELVDAAAAAFPASRSQPQPSTRPATH